MSQSLTIQEQQYREQLRDKRWLIKRKLILDREQNMCKCCGATNALQVHHRQYHVNVDTGAWKAPWQYADYLLVTLCQTCHQAGHQQYKVPVFYIEVKAFMLANRMHAW